MHLPALTAPASLLAASSGLLLSIVVATALFVLWVVALFLIAVEDISVGSKVLWFVLCTLLAPFAIPVYLIVRSRRRRAPA
jgi:hypothetical protein